MRKLFPLFIISAVIVAGCSSPAVVSTTVDTPPVIAVVSDSSAMSEKSVAGAVEYAKQNDVAVSVFKASGNDRELGSILDSVTTAKPDGIIFFSTDAAKYSDRLKAAVDKGISLITVGDSAKAASACFATDYSKLGKALGESAAKSGSKAALIYDSNSSLSNAVYMGAKAALEQAGVEIAAEKYDQTVTNDGFNAVKALYDKYGDGISSYIAADPTAAKSLSSFVMDKDIDKPVYAVAFSNISESFSINYSDILIPNLSTSGSSAVAAMEKLIAGSRPAAFTDSGYTKAQRTTTKSEGSLIA